jgi:branched-chain amino acid transport system permease protein
VLGQGLRLAHLTEWLTFALAALALGIAVGIGRLPSLAQGAFVAIGAFGAALLQTRAGWPPAAAVPAATLAAAALGAVAGIGLVRLRPAFVAAGTWLLTWLAAAALAGFPGLSGGTDGITVAAPAVAGLELRPWLLYELALALVALAVLAFGAYARGLPGLALAALGQSPAGAAALGLPRARLRLAAFAAAAAAGGLAGAIEVQAAGIADPAAYEPLLSFELLGAVVLGGAARALGPLAGTAIVALAGAAAGTLTAVGTLEPAHE